MRYLLPSAVIDYIEANGLYLDEGPNTSNAQYMQQLRDQAKVDRNGSPSSALSAASSSSASSSTIKSSSTSEDEESNFSES